MSWRFILIVLLITAGFSAWGGIGLGNWLVARSPQTPALTDAHLPADVPVLDADGRPFTAQAPQPLLDGRQGIPQPGPAIDWHIPEKSLIHDDILPPIAIATTHITMDEAMAIAQADERPQSLAIQPVELPPAPAAAPTPENDQNPLTQGNWELALHQEIQACSRLGFFQRPSCAWAARKRYCEPNNAWGRTANCPAKSF